MKIISYVTNISISLAIMQLIDSNQSQWKYFDLKQVLFEKYQTVDLFRAKINTMNKSHFDLSNHNHHQGFIVTNKSFLVYYHPN